MFIINISDYFITNLEILYMSNAKIHVEHFNINFFEILYMSNVESREQFISTSTHFTALGFNVFLQTALWSK
jgi:hypothetical protein